MLTNRSVDVAVITETRLNTNTRLNIRGYHIYRGDRLGRPGRGVAILVRKNVPHIPMPRLNIEPENLSIQLKDNTILRALYNNPRHVITNAEYDEMFSGPRTLVVGDLNARHVVWYNHRNNRNAPDTLTHYTFNRSRPTFLDIVVNKNYPHNQNPTTLTDLSSDRNPVLMSLSKTETHYLDRQIYDYRTTNWRTYRNYLNRTCVTRNTIQTRRDIDEQVHALTEAIIHARNITTEQKTIRQKEKRNP
ncbi:hypothetical protein NQ315_014728 [Exocentrus adspersus]|uniref:Endonuclease/exonuclease/phosphatase domain-containing protein n=1 Tax=Exocentrus adspersus TaxID=1586481 RepID=A0AAV8VDH7_9CUCU|nr:hypothetical protein NQ315_014728 [Exocentrus adspersus]